MNLNIYTIPAEIQAALNAMTIDEETGEVIGWERLDELTKGASDKIANTARFIRYAEAQIDAMDKAIADIKARKQSAQNLVDKLSVLAVKALFSLPDGKAKVEEPDIKVTARPSDVVQIDDESKLDEKFFNVRIIKERKVSKTAINNAIKSGEEVQGARLLKNYTLQIK